MRKNYFLIALAIVFTVNGMAQNIPSYVPKDGLVGYWPFNGNANDESGNGNNGTVNGATLSADRNGKENSAYSFDGVSNFITINNNILNNKIPTSFAISLWVDFDTTKQCEIISNRYGQDCGYNYRLLKLDNKLIFGNHIANPWTWDSCSTELNSTSEWNQITFMYDLNDKRLKLYLNGKFVGANNTNIWFDGNNPTIIGALLGCGQGSFYSKGTFDDIAIYNRALTEQEINALYTGCTNETATSSSFNSLLFTNGNAISVAAEPQGGVFTGTSIENNQFIPSKAKIGSNKVKYNFKNSQGCADSTVFNMVVADTVGKSCTKFDTVIVKTNVFDTVKVNKFDTITITNNITKYDTVIVKTNVFDTVKVNKYDTITVTKYDTVIVPKTVTKYDTVKVNTYDTITITNNVTKYDTVKVTKFDTVTITNNVTKYDTVIVNKTNYDTVGVLKIKFKLTTGINANQLSSLSIYPNPTSDVLHIEVSDVKALEGYRYRILDALGKEVYNELVTQTTTEIPLKTIGAAGIYQFEILDATKTSIQSNKIVLH